MVDQILNQSQTGPGQPTRIGFGDKVVKQIQVQQNKHIKTPAGSAKPKKKERVQREPLFLKNHLENIEKHEQKKQQA